jgi:hypothetical protein
MTDLAAGATVASPSRVSQFHVTTVRCVLSVAAPRTVSSRDERAERRAQFLGRAYHRRDAAGPG